jgi:hypothetical protein
MENKIAQLLKVLAIIVFVIGGLVSLLFMMRPDAMLLAIFGTLVPGTLLLGFSEIIRLLHRIAEQTKSTS